MPTPTLTLTPTREHRFVRQRFRCGLRRLPLGVASLAVAVAVATGSAAADEVGGEPPRLAEAEGVVLPLGTEQPWRLTAEESLFIARVDVPGPGLLTVWAAGNPETLDDITLTLGDRHGVAYGGTFDDDPPGLGGEYGTRAVPGGPATVILRPYEITTSGPMSGTLRAEFHPLPRVAPPDPSADFRDAAVWRAGDTVTFDIGQYGDAAERWFYLPPGPAGTARLTFRPLDADADEDLSLDYRYADRPYSAVSIASDDAPLTYHTIPLREGVGTFVNLYGWSEHEARPIEVTLHRGADADTPAATTDRKLRRAPR